MHTLRAFKTQSLKRLLNLKSSNSLALFSTSEPVLDIHTKGIELNTPLRTRINNKLLKVVKKLGKDALSAHVLIKVLKLPESGTERMNNTDFTIVLLERHY